MNKIKVLLLIFILCIGAAGCKKKVEEASVEEVIIEPEILKEFIIEDDSIPSISTVLGVDRVLAYDKYLNVEPPLEATPSDANEDGAESDKKSNRKLSTTTSNERKSVKVKIEAKASESQSETTEADKKGETKASEKETKKSDKEETKASEKETKKSDKKEETKASEKETKKSDKKEETKASEKETKKSDKEGAKEGEDVEGEGVEEEIILDPDDDGQKKVIYAFEYLEEGSTDAQTYIKYLLENESFTSQWDYYPEAPAGYVSLIRDSVTNRWNFQVDVDYTQRDMRVILKKWKKPEEPKEPMANNVPRIATLSTQGTIDFLNNNFTAEALGLPADKPLSEYSLIPNPGQQIMNGEQYYVVNIYNNLPNYTNTIAGTYFISLNGSKLYKYDLASNVYTELKTAPADTLNPPEDETSSHVLHTEDSPN